MAAKTDNETIIELINKQINGELTSEEQVVLEDWLKNPANQMLYDRLTDKRLILKKRFEYDEYNVDKAWQKVNKRISPKLNIRRWISYAAAIILPLALFYVVYQLSEVPQSNTSPMAESIQPGQRKAVLVLSDGQQVELSAADTTIQTHAINIQIDSLGAHYEGGAGNNEQRYNTIQTSRGMEYSLKLADGTKVWLNSESSLRYPENFTGNTREVYASGEVYLEVTKNKEKPFYVHFNDKRIKVLGTEFNVRAYPDETEDLVTLVEGSVALSAANDEVVLKPNEQATCRANKAIKVNTVNTTLYTAWKEGRFVYRDAPLEQIVNDLARWYDVEIFYQNKGMKQERFSLNTNRRANIQLILEALELTETVQFKVSGRNIVIQSVN
ncbi:MAG: DUF4974 domain-containing protein [Bacteroidales bacterium]|nr:DUF4974 domain-containing protein [Bacteroidales bacterium]